MASTFTHKAYGHALFKILGVPSAHGDSKDRDKPDCNKDLENQIEKSTNEAEKNYVLQSQ